MSLEVVEPAPGVDRPSAFRWRAVAVGVVVVAFLCSWWVLGPPVTRPGQLLWILVIILTATAGRGMSVPRILLDWLPVFVLLVIYDQTRGWATHLGIGVHYSWAIEADKDLFHGVVPTQWLQAHLFDPAAIHWWDQVAALFYISHFVVWLALGTTLYVLDRGRWAAFMRRFLLLSAAGLTTYVLYPAAPPWLAHRHDLLPGVLPLTWRGLGAWHMAPTERWLTLGAAESNPVAAVPSLHAGISMLVVLFLIRSAAHPWRRVWLLAYPLGMAFALVYCGDHYVVDVLLGWGYAVGAMMICEVWERRRRSSSRHREGATVS